MYLLSVTGTSIKQCLDKNPELLDTFILLADSDTWHRWVTLRDKKLKPPEENPAVIAPIKENNIDVNGVCEENIPNPPELSIDVDEADEYNDEDLQKVLVELGRNESLSDLSGREKAKLRLYKCKDCGQRFSYKSYLDDHRTINHKSPTKNQTPFSCKFCHQHFKTNQTLVRHQRSEHANQLTYDCSTCGKSFKAPENLKLHERVHSGLKPFTCEFCKKTFRQRAHLTYHLRTHTGEKPYTCPTCDQAFAHKSAMTCHIRIHTGERPYTCDDCGKTFREKCKLLVHQRIHTGERPYKCGTCDKTFTQAGNLQKHELIHSGIKPYKCTVCDMAFTQLVYLQMHHRTHTGEKPFKCEVCDKNFRNRLTLKIHMRWHNNEKPYSCDQCGKSFRQLAHLKYHRRAHKGERIFPCTECGKKFTNPLYVKVHMRIHTGETPYKCDVCGNGFRYLKTLQDHMKTHGEESTVPTLRINHLATKRNNCAKKTPARKSKRKKISASATAVSSETIDETGTLVQEGTSTSQSNSQKKRASLKLSSQESTVIKSSCSLPKIFHCQLCSKVYGRKGHLDNHLRTHSAKETQAGKAKPLSKTDANSVKMPVSKKGKKRKLIRKKPPKKVIKVAFIRQPKTPVSETDSIPENNINQSNVVPLVDIKSEPVYVCSICNSSFIGENDFQDHVFTHGPVLFECNICHSQFSSMSELDVHNVSHVNPSEIEYTFWACNSCEGRFSSADELSQHVQMHHSHITVQVDGPCRSSEPVVTSGAISVTRDTISHHNVNSNTDDSTQLVNTLEQQAYKCTYCHTAFMNCESLEAHIEIHAKENSALNI